MLSKFFLLQIESPRKGDWASTCLDDLRKLRITDKLEDIKLMSKNQFTKLIKMRIQENAYTYLVRQQGSKGKENIYSHLIMADYLLPENSVLTISEKQKLFAIKNRMITIPGNFPKPGIENNCQCGMKEDMQHIYLCEIYNEQSKPRIEYMRIYNGSISARGLTVLSFSQSTSSFLNK